MFNRKLKKELNKIQHKVFCIEAINHLTDMQILHLNNEIKDLKKQNKKTTKAGKK